ncbi:MAG: KTSC domain-containing protein [Mucilaginibacter sp.]
MPSSVVAEFDYNSETLTLRVTYVSGMIYDYLKVPERVYKEMKAYQSKGSFLNHYIKGKYKFKKITT